MQVAVLTFGDLLLVSGHQHAGS